LNVFFATVYTVYVVHVRVPRTNCPYDLDHEIVVEERFAIFISGGPFSNPSLLRRGRRGGS
jgi:hypothetical protein